MSESSRRKWLRFVPGAVWGRAGGLFFFLYVAVCLVRLPVLLDLAASPLVENRLGALIIMIGAVLLYVAAVFPALLRREPDRRRLAAWKGRFRTNRLAVVGLWFFLAALVLSLLSPIIAPYDPAAQHDPALNRYQAPSLQHPMGTDKFGRDLFSRVLYGSRVSLTVSVAAVVFASFLGLFFGAFSGYFGGWVDDVAMRVVDGLLAFPRLLLILTLLAFFAHALWVVVALLAATGWMGIARLVRAEVLSLKKRDFVQAAHASGAGRLRVVLKHLLPNTAGLVVVAATLRVGTIILLESYLSFLGLGVQPPTPSWGSMVFEGRDVLLSAWWVSAFPGLALVLAVVACNLLGDGLRDAMDVKRA